MRWKRVAGLLLLLTLTGCAAAAPLHLPVSICPENRPAILDEDGRMTEEGKAWLGACLNAGRDNCRALKAVNRQDVDACDYGLK